MSDHHIWLKGELEEAVSRAMNECGDLKICTGYFQDLIAKHAKQMREEQEHE